MDVRLKNDTEQDHRQLFAGTIGEAIKMRYIDYHGYQNLVFDVILYGLPGIFEFFPDQLESIP